MRDELYVYTQEIKEKKATGRGAFHKVRGGGRHVRTAADTMTRKELNKLNGEVQTYNMNGPVAWNGFKKWPEDIQKEYFRKLYEDFGFSTTMMANAFGVTHGTVAAFAKGRGIKLRNKGVNPTTEAKKRFVEFMAGKALEAPATTREEPETKWPEEFKPIKKPERLIPTAGTVEFTGGAAEVAAALVELLGNRKGSYTVMWSLEA